MLSSWEDILVENLHEELLPVGVYCVMAVGSAASKRGASRLLAVSTGKDRTKQCSQASTLLEPGHSTYLQAGYVELDRICVQWQAPYGPNG